jgi:hypothetical protein
MATAAAIWLEKDLAVWISYATVVLAAVTTADTPTTALYLRNVLHN